MPLIRSSKIMSLVFHIQFYYIWFHYSKIYKYEKKNLNSLKLNKKSVSNLNYLEIKGGKFIVDAGSWLFPGCDTHPLICQETDAGCGITEYCPLQTKSPCLSQVPNYSCECTIA